MELRGPDGHLSLAISCIAGRWFFERLYWTITRATGREPIAFHSPLHYTTATFVVPRPGAKLDEAAVAARAKLAPTSPMERVATTSDDWPFLHLRPGVVPWGYLAVIGAVLALAAACARPVFGLGAGGGDCADAARRRSGRTCSAQCSAGASNIFRCSAGWARWRCWRRCCIWARCGI